MEKNREIYYGSATEARKAGVIVTWRDSLAAVEETADMIDAAINEHFDGWRLPEEALASVIETAGADRVAIVLAATVMDRKYDGRFYTGVRAWAAGVRLPDIGTDRLYRIACRSHSTIVNGMAQQFIRRSQAGQ